ncbi:alpha/beta fold hydrolase [Paracoccus sp. MBLB3053]|uniref:Alpha/beta fold hydrolase n=1 Tax=Paracoccus aurantius TaxID=3073814 RepID=A0ABU2HYQ6_9RHOB|nr:alpha/beta fold hydrolase [Paracoccus sp. MBLB3053]MDS9470186.1 alpha/beta fold hydrolase [Paracoccus sp. MBLB3053]
MNTTLSYRDQSNWREIQSHLPKRYQIRDDLPEEEIWSWHGHQIHLDRYRRPDSPVRVILFHGVGTNGRQMTTILGRPLAQSGIETVSIDMPTYGMTRVAPGTVVTYEDWVQAGTDFVAAELERDARPIFLYGLSAGGMLAYHIASRSANVAGIIGMTFLDLREKKVAIGTSYNNLIGEMVPMSNFLGKQPGISRLKVPMRLVSKMHALVNDKAAMQTCLRDRTSAGNFVSLAFIRSFMQARYDVEPEDFDVCPILLTQPAADRWTPLDYSTPFLKRIRKVPVKTVMLENAGHYPIEEPGLTQLHDAVLDFLRETQSGIPAANQDV